jgi:hypothetical protein
MDPTLAIQAVDRIAEELAAIDPGGAATYTAEIRAMDDWWLPASPDCPPNTRCWSRSTTPMATSALRPTCLPGSWVRTWRGAWAEATLQRADSGMWLASSAIANKGISRGPPVPLSSRLQETGSK